MVLIVPLLVPLLVVHGLLGVLLVRVQHLGVVLVLVCVPVVVDGGAIVLDPSVLGRHVGGGPILLAAVLLGLLLRLLGGLLLGSVLRRHAVALGRRVVATAPSQLVLSRQRGRGVGGAHGILLGVVGENQRDLGPAGVGLAVHVRANVVDKQRVQQVGDALLLRERDRAIERNPHALEVHSANLDHPTVLLRFQHPVAATACHPRHVQEFGAVDHIIVLSAGHADAPRLHLETEGVFVLPQRGGHTRTRLGGWDRHSVGLRNPAGLRDLRDLRDLGDLRNWRLLRVQGLLIDGFNTGHS